MDLDVSARGYMTTIIGRGAHVKLATVCYHGEREQTNMIRRERLMATLRGEPVDRPAVNFYEIGGFTVDPADRDSYNIYNSPDWQPLLELADEHTDIIRMMSPVRARSIDPTGSAAGAFGTSSFMRRRRTTAARDGRGPS